MTSPAPTTRHSLVLRLSDAQDGEAWEEFVAIYEPLIYRLARNKGLQDSDAAEVVQEVLVAVAGAVERWEPDPERGRFRDWLFCIARRLVIKFLTRRKHRPIGSGGSAIVELLQQQADPASDAESAQTAEFDLEYRREVFRWAAERVRDRVTPNTWQAFWRTTVECEPSDAVANQLGMSVGAVHIARSRVRGRLREEVGRFERRQASGEG